MHNKTPTLYTFGTTLRSSGWDWAAFEWSGAENIPFLSNAAQPQPQNLFQSLSRQHSDCNVLVYAPSLDFDIRSQIEPTVQFSKINTRNYGKNWECWKKRRLVLEFFLNNFSSISRLSYRCFENVNKIWSLAFALFGSTSSTQRQQNKTFLIPLVWPQGISTRTFTWKLNIDFIYDHNSFYSTAIYCTCVVQLLYKEPSFQMSRTLVNAFDKVPKTWSENNTASFCFIDWVLNFYADNLVVPKTISDINHQMYYIKLLPNPNHTGISIPKCNDKQNTTFNIVFMLLSVLHESLDNFDRFYL